ncbi:ABC-type transport auxiliary lipoprotein family protein [Zoogloea sp.]|uniref:ABC-type transport auxiliary lipoprotein family protein n=1 Tax=Zoogloea sp. TaxID=49181 RepID=UPI001415ED80|nr:MAG: hypothetical protein F9K15_08740 [Zoogloea sp.]
MRLVHPVAAASLALLLSACAVPSRPAAQAVHDFGVLDAVAAPAGIPALRSIEVQPAPWLASSAMGYRLLQAQPTRRQVYAESRWAAPPAQLVELALRRALGPGQGGCRLRIELDEFAQLFEAGGDSRGVVEARASLLPSRGERVVASRAFSISRPAPAADAAGGVAALQAATRDLGRELAGWLSGLNQGAAGQGALPKPVAPCAD